MGTSGKYGGSHPGLLPSWLLQPDGGSAAPAGAPGGEDGGGGDDSKTSAPFPHAPAQQAMPAFTGTFQSARTAFTGFAKTRDSHRLGRAVSRYVNHGAGGGKRAALQMGASRAVAGRLVALAGAAQRSGAEQALHQFNLESLAGKPAAEVFLSILETVCPTGGSVSDAISRQAMLDAITHLADAGAVNFDDLTAVQWREFLLDFVACSVEGKIVSEIGEHMVSVPANAADVCNVEAQLHDFIEGSVHDTLEGKLTDVASLNEAQISATVNSIYEAAFDFIGLLGDE